jgi:hypothetical protein
VSRSLHPPPYNSCLTRQPKKGFFMNFSKLKSRASSIASNATSEDVKRLSRIVVELCDQCLTLEQTAKKAERRAEQSVKVRPAAER